MDEDKLEYIKNYENSMQMQMIYMADKLAKARHLLTYAHADCRTKKEMREAIEEIDKIIHEVSTKLVGK